MRVLVTGATGFIGRHLVQALTQAGAETILLVRENYAGQRPLPHPLSRVYADLRNYNLVTRAVREAAPARVVHLAAAGVTDPFLPLEEAIRHNLTGTLNLLRACFERKDSATRPAQFIVARTPGELRAMNVYAASKAAVWAFCRMFAGTQDWPVLGAMIFQCYGPGQPDHALIPSALNAALAGSDYPMTSGRQQRDWIYVGDVVEGIVRSLDTRLAPGTTFDLGTGRLITVADAVRLVYDLAGGRGRPLIGVLPDRTGEERVQAANVGRTKELLGWEAAVSLEEGLRHLLGAPGTPAS